MSSNSRSEIVKEGKRKKLNAEEEKLKRRIGWNANYDEAQSKKYIALKLKSMGLYPVEEEEEEGDSLYSFTEDLLTNYQEKTRLLQGEYNPPDKRIQNFINRYVTDTKDLLNGECKLPDKTFILTRHGVARILSLPENGEFFESEFLSSYKVQQGVLHNPSSDKRTTKGVFHIAEGGLPIPADKIAVPKHVFFNLLHEALAPPKDLMQLPYTAGRESAGCWVSLYLQPVVCPAVPGVCEEKKMEIRVFAPGNFVCNLDFLESIFGNEGDPYLTENDLSVDVEHWTGHTGCIILAPHLRKLTKKYLGLPHYMDATEKQRESGMCWQDEDEKYHDGEAFKIVFRSHDGIITILADNYFGYCKKEVKTQISFAANFFGLSEEEHSGGALTFPSYNLGMEVKTMQKYEISKNYSVDAVFDAYKDMIDVHPDGYGIHKKYPHIHFIRENSEFDLLTQKISWEDKEGNKKQLNMLPGNKYYLPSGYRIHVERDHKTNSSFLVGTSSSGLVIHKPATVSGGGKSELSKSISNSIISGSYFVNDINEDLDMVDEILKRDYSDRFRSECAPPTPDTRSVLSSERSLGSVIKLLNPSASTFTEKYNSWLATIPNHVRAIVFLVKNLYKPEWEGEWRKHFSVDIVNGSKGHELKYHNRKLFASYVRVGIEKDGSWRTFKLRQDFRPAVKVQFEDDITSSVVVPTRKLSGLSSHITNDSVKIVYNCEYRLFQRPDEAVNRGYDVQTEEDMAGKDVFISNFQPLTKEDATKIRNECLEFYKFTPPMFNLIKNFSEGQGSKSTYLVSSAHPRLVDGAPSKNPRYLQNRQDLVDPMALYEAELSNRLHRRINPGDAVVFPVDTVFGGRRNNPPEAKIRNLAVYNPIHYQDLPELFMDLVSCLTGRSPSTTGAGSEGALTKGPFNMLCPAADLNNALVSYILTGYDGFTSTAGYCGPKYRVDHDISLLIPELWCRMSPEERQSTFLKEGYLEQLEDFEYKGQKVLASRLGYRINEQFVKIFLGRIFDTPSAVFTEDMLKIENQGMDEYVDGINNIVEAQRNAAALYFEDGSVEDACPPLKALLHIMTYGNYKGKTAQDPEVRKMFTKDHLLTSDWYLQRLVWKQVRDIRLWNRHVHNLEEYMSKKGRKSHKTVAEHLKIDERLQYAKKKLEYVQTKDYFESLKGTIGADFVFRGLVAADAEKMKEVTEIATGTKVHKK